MCYNLAMNDVAISETLIGSMFKSELDIVLRRNQGGMIGITPTHQNCVAVSELAMEKGRSSFYDIGGKNGEMLVGLRQNEIGRVGPIITCPNTLGPRRPGVIGGVADRVLGRRRSRLFFK